jgi:phage tail-like protein
VSYLDHLPAVFREDPFVGDLLNAVQSVFDDLAAKVDGIVRYLDPMTTDVEFLPWLSGWVALTLRADWSEETQRSFLQQIVPLYRDRGTRTGLQRMLTLYTGQPVEVDDDFEQVPHFFQVRLTLRESDPQLLRQMQQIARAIIDQEKPAHTFYGLQLAVPTMRLVSPALQRREESARRPVPELLVLGENTLLGTANQTSERTS